MNREDIKPGDCLKLSCTVQEEYMTGVGYATMREGKIFLNVAWKHGGVWTTDLESMGDHVEFRLLVEQKQIKPRKQPDFIMSEWKLLPDRRKELEALDTTDWKKMVQYIFGGLVPGDIISNRDNSEIICLETAASGNVRGYHLNANGKWSTKSSIVFGLSIGYQKMIRD